LDVIYFLEDIEDKSEVTFILRGSFFILFNFIRVNYAFDRSWD